IDDARSDAQVATELAADDNPEPILPGSSENHVPTEDTACPMVGPQPAKKSPTAPAASVIHCETVSQLFHSSHASPIAVVIASPQGPRNLPRLSSFGPTLLSREPARAQNDPENTAPAAVASPSPRAFKNPPRAAVPAARPLVVASAASSAGIFSSPTPCAAFLINPKVSATPAPTRTIFPSASVSSPPAMTQPPSSPMV